MRNEDVAQAIARRVAEAITAPAIGGTDAQGGHVESLTEAVMGITSALTAIATAIEHLATAVEDSAWSRLPATTTCTRCGTVLNGMAGHGCANDVEGDRQ